MNIQDMIDRVFADEGFFGHLIDDPNTILRREGVQVSQSVCKSLQELGEGDLAELMADVNWVC